MAELYLLTGEIHSGKTTALLKWTDKRNDVYGILTPVINGRRVFMDVAAKEIFEMEAIQGEESLIVGKYRFKKSSFDKAVRILSSAKEKEGWIIVDEIGPLELKNEGFSEVVKSIIPLLNKDRKAIFVVRHSLLQQVVAHFQLQKVSYRIISIESELFQS